ncbi:MAG: Na-translocating system protein MpsB, partial [Herbaspirillum sp.]
CKDDEAASHAFHTVQQAWARSQERLEQVRQDLLVDELWQVALEVGYQRKLAAALLQQSANAAPPVEVQAAFCIDVRSEPLRRALEAVHPGMQTMGFAGFFGLPVAYTPLATEASRPQLPGLLAPAYQVQDVVAPAGTVADGGVLASAVARARRKTLAFKEQWQGNTRWPGSAFSFVEVAGVTALGGLWKWLQPGQAERARDDLAGLPARYRELCRPQLVGVALEDKVALAARVLHAMGLDRQVAPLVLLAGHGSQSANNAHAAALDCGACCGQTGEVNARTLAQLLNEQEVRRGLLDRQIFIPEGSHFLAVLHNTTTDEIEAFDLDLMPAAARARWQALQPALAEAGDRVRRERALRLGMEPAQAAPALLKQLRRRANDGAETRPEWGLTGNAAFLIAPRSRSRGLDLGGRCFLHDYEASEDQDGSVLELLMTAPMLVTHWINWQYHASTSDPQRLGSGNKLLHNVVGGTIGVFEGNGGDLRIGLSRQSLHDGQQWVHEPLRLTVVIDAPAEAIDAVVGRHAIVRQLLEHGWLHLWRFGEAGLEQWRREGWKSIGL